MGAARGFNTRDLGGPGWSSLASQPMGRRAAHHVTWSSRLEEFHPGPSSTVISQQPADGRRVQQPKSSASNYNNKKDKLVVKEEVEEESVKCVVVRYWTVEMGEVKVATVEGGGGGGVGGGGGGGGVQQTPQELLIDNMATLPVGGVRQQQQQHAADISPERNNFTNKEMEAKKSGRSSANPSTHCQQQQPKR